MKNEIKQIIYSLHRTNNNKKAEKVYNIVMNSIKL